MAAINKAATPTWAKGVLKLLLKVVVSGLCLWYISTKVDGAATLQLFLTSNWLYVAIALLFFTASKWVAAVRLQIYFKEIDIHLANKPNLQLYWLGMFYNLFLPGGIGGDAYKVILLHRKFPAIKVKVISAAVLLDRISGLAGLAILAALITTLVFGQFWLGWLPLFLVIPGVFLFRWLVRQLFPSFKSSFFSTLWLGIAVQALQMICMAFILQSIGITHQQAVFQWLFLLSSVVAIFPFTIGGLGARELVFLWGSQQFGIVQQEAVFASLMFYGITLIVSLPGLVGVFNQPLKQLPPKEN